MTTCRRRSTPELCALALRMVQEHQQDYPSQAAVAQAVARQLGLGRETVRRWIVQAEIDDGARSGVTSVEQAEIKRLKAENRRLREDVDILRAATTFSRESATPATVDHGVH
jgi:transposase